MAIEQDNIIDSLLDAGTQFAKETVAGYLGLNSGVQHETISEPVPDYDSAPSESVIRGKQNTIIIMGRDRPRSKTSGKGAIPSTHVGCIDIIAGMSGILARRVNAEGAKVLTNKSPELDAARIYISQRSDIDSPEYFNLAAGSVGNPTNTSAIAIKADSVRVIGREGIKLVTGGDTYSGASGFLIKDKIPGIDLIAGNDDTELEPLVKGEKLVQALDKTVEHIQKMNSSVGASYKVLIKLMEAISAVATIAPPVAAALKIATLVLKTEAQALSDQSFNLIMHKYNYQYWFGKYYFKSYHNNTN